MNPIATWKASVFGINNLLESVIGTKTKLFHLIFDVKILVGSTMELSG